MTKTQIWVAAFLGLFLILFGISHLTKKEEPVKSNAMPNMAEEQSNNEEQNAVSLIRNNACTSCHGTDLKGTSLGPSLINVKQFWSNRDELISYLRNPQSFMDKDRFQRYKEKYSSVVMPPFNNLDIKELGKITDYLMGL